MVAFAAVYFVLHLPKVEESHWKEKLGRIDFLGAFCLVIATFTLLLGLDRGSNVSWSSNLAIVCLSVSSPLFAIFILVEMKWASNPFAPGHIIFERSLFASYLCNFFGIGGYMATLFYMPLFFQAVDGVSAFDAGLRLIPGIIASVLGSIGGGIIMQKTGKYYWITVMAYALLTCGATIIVLFSGLILNSTIGIITGLVFTGFGGGMGVTTTLIALIANADPKDQAIATACSYLFRSLGSVLGLSISATVVQQSLRTQLRAKLSDGDEADKIVERVRQSLDYINELDPRTRELVRGCYQKATNAAFGLTVLLVSGALVASFFIREKKLSK
jgi:MFS family permease